MTERIQKKVIVGKNMQRKPPHWKAYVVHLGNLEGGEEKTRNYAKRFPAIKFIGIDKTKYKGAREKNWQQIQASFVTGLRKLKDNSVSIINSELALGQYGRIRYDVNEERIRKHTKEALEIAYKKLKKGGKLHLAVGENVISMVKDVLTQTPFGRKHIEITEIDPKHYARTQWLRFMPGKKYQISIEK